MWPKTAGQPGQTRGAEDDQHQGEDEGEFQGTHGSSFRRVVRDLPDTGTSQPDSPLELRDEVRQEAGQLHRRVALDAVSGAGHVFHAGLGLELEQAVSSPSPA